MTDPLRTPVARVSDADRSQTVGERIAELLSVKTSPGMGGPPESVLDLYTPEGVAVVICAALGIDPATPLANLATLPLRDADIDAAEWAEIDRLRVEVERLTGEISAAAVHLTMALLPGLSSPATEPGGDGPGTSRPSSPRSPDYRIALRPDLDRGDPMEHDTLLDDIVVKDVPMFRAEDMGDHWWVCCYLGDDGTHDRICWSVRARKKGVIEWTTTEYPTDVTYEHALNTTVRGLTSSNERND